MVAMGFVPDLVIGSDAAGVVSRIGTKVKKLSVGDRVALIQVGAMRTNIRIDESLPQKLPDAMSMEHGSTLPTIYVTAYQSLIEIGRLEKEETVLIHSAAGGKILRFFTNNIFQVTYDKIRTRPSSDTTCPAHRS